jgi:hypothetical protein
VCVCVSEPCFRMYVFTYVRTYLCMYVYVAFLSYVCIHLWYAMFMVELHMYIRMVCICLCLGFVRMCTRMVCICLCLNLPCAEESSSHCRFAMSSSP